MTDQPSVASLLRSHGLRPNKRLGQSFLADPALLGRIADAAGLQPDDMVVEVGAGLGTLTRLLAERAAQVLAVEIDDGLLEILREQVAGLSNVQVIPGDILRVSLPCLAPHGYKLVGNVPYYITSAILRRFLEQAPRPSRLVVTVQREVAERIVAAPGEMSLLAVSVQFYGQPQIVARIPAGAFLPPPEVDSAVLRIDVFEDPAVPGVDEKAFFRAVRAGFGQKRKTLRNSLRAGLALDAGQVVEALTQAGVDPERRAETLSLSEWGAVVRALAPTGESPFAPTGA
jgi:16S rRNA (adenine1518-N6/adenine1519-N6)-dimethyltransferase